MTDLRAAEAEFRLPLNATRQFIKRYVVIADEAADFLALWVAHTHAFEAALTTPYVRVTSAERASGKTRLLECLSLLVRRGWLAVNPSAAVVFRKGDSDAPTLLLDEIDQTPFGDRRDLLAVLNAGYRIGVKVPAATTRATCTNSTSSTRRRSAASMTASCPTRSTAVRCRYGLSVVARTS
jgi:hypothetical protein